MAFGGNMINFNVSDSVEKPNHVRSCFAIDVVKNIGQEPSVPIRKNESSITIKKGSGVENKKHATILKTPNLAESTSHAFVDSAATFEPSLQYISEPPIPIPIPISTNRFLPSVVQVPNQIQDGGTLYIDFRKLKATIRKDHYPLPFIYLMHKNCEEHVVEDGPLMSWTLMELK
ncbi:hypothetical protein ACFX1T_027733 [Malus domestica]